MIGSCRRVSRVMCVAGLAFVAGVVGAAPAHGASLAQDYRCAYPLLGSRALTLEVTAGVPGEWRAGALSPAFDIDARMTPDLTTREGFGLFETRTIEGTATASLRAAGLGYDLAIDAPLDIPQVDVPPAPGEFVLVGAGRAAQVPVSEFAFGAGEVTVEDLQLNLRVRDSSGTSVVLPPLPGAAPDSDGDPATFDVACSLDDGEERKLADIDVNGGIVPDDLQPPTAPGTPVATDVTMDSATISWEASTDNVGVVSYSVTTNAATQSVPGDQTSLALTGLAPDTEYRIRVRAQDRFNSSAPSGDLVFRTAPDTDPPPVPTGLTATAARTSVALSWHASAGAAQYEVFRNGDPVKTVTNPTATVDGLCEATAYAFKVRALDAAGNVSAFSNELTITTMTSETGSDLAQDYRCAFPLVGQQPMSLVLDAAIPATWPEGRLVPGFEVRGRATLDRDVAQGLGLIGAATVGGRGTISVTLRAPGFGGGVPLKIPITTSPADVPGPDGTIVIFFEGQTPSFTFPDPGTATFDVDAVTFSLNARRSDGTIVNLPGTFPDEGDPTRFTVPCELLSEQPRLLRLLTVTPSGDVPEEPPVPPTTPTNLTATPASSSVALSWTASTDNVGVVGYDVFRDGQLVQSVGPNPAAVVGGLTPGTAYTFKVRAKDAAGGLSPFSEEITVRVLADPAPTVKYPFTLKGSSQLKALTQGSVPLSGSIDPTLDLATGAFTADLTLNKSRARLKVLGVLPVTADIAFTQTDKTRGTLKDGVLSAQARFKIRLPQLYLFGTLPIVSPDTCQTKSSSVAIMRSDAGFDPLRGGRLTGTYGISDLTGCGLLTSFISPLTKGAGNTIDLTLTPKAGGAPAAS